MRYGKCGYRNMRERVQVKNKPVSLIFRGYNVMMYVTCTSACYRVSHWMEGFKCRKLDSSDATLFKYTLKGNVGGRLKSFFLLILVFTWVL